MDITAHLTQHQEGARTRYDLNVGRYTFHFWNVPDLQRFVGEDNPRDDLITKFTRRALRRALETRTPAQLVTFLSTPRSFRVNEAITIEDL